MGFETSGRRTAGALMVCGTTSNAGKSTIVAGLCRVLARRDVRVAPFKAQNMANNSAVTADGGEIGRAQAWQALAAGVAPEVAMNPILLKPVADRASQVVVMGRPTETVSAAEFHRRKPALLDVVLSALADLRARFDVVILEGAGSPAEINLLDRDIVNLEIAHRAGIPAVVVGDIDLGGVFAALYGTVALLPDRYRRLVGGFVINKFRGDPALLGDAVHMLEDRCAVPTLGVLPWLDGPTFDGEDSLTLDQGHAHAPIGDRETAAGDVLDVAVLRFPRIANFTDFDPLLAEPAVRLRFVHDAAGLGRPDLLVLPGSKAPVADLAWLRARGLDTAIIEAATSGTTILGICAGAQMLGRRIADPGHVESPEPLTDGLALLDVTTEFGADKFTANRSGTAFGQPLHGYQIHHGRLTVSGSEPFTHLDASPTGASGPEGASSGAVHGTTLHGLFEADGFRRAFLGAVAKRAGKAYVAGPTTFESLRQAAIDRIADAIEAHIDLAAIDALIAQGAPTPHSVSA
ncbi:MAG: cobyric acid synthase [Acidimicrobiales bacterium]